MNLDLNRRGFIGVLAGAAFTAQIAPHLVEVSCCRSGRYLPGTRILLDGKDASSDCFRAEKFRDGNGVAYYYARNKKGRFFLTSEGNAAEYRASGRIDIIPPEYVKPEAWANAQRHWLEAERA